MFAANGVGAGLEIGVRAQAVPPTALLRVWPVCPVNWKTKVALQSAGAAEGRHYVG